MLKSAAIFLYPYIYYYLLVINLIALILMTYDKLVSKTGKVRLRIPERTLLWLPVLGGALGSFIGMQVFRHKSRHTSFKIIIPLFLIIWIIISLYILLVHFNFI